MCVSPTGLEVILTETVHSKKSSRRRVASLDGEHRARALVGHFFFFAPKYPAYRISCFLSSSPPAVHPRSNPTHHNTPTHQDNQHRSLWVDHGRISMKLELFAAVAVAGGGCPRADAFVPAPSPAVGLTSTTRLMSAISTRPDAPWVAGDGESRRRRRRRSSAARVLSMKSQATPVKADVSRLCGWIAWLVF